MLTACRTKDILIVAHISERDGYFLQLELKNSMFTARVEQMPSFLLVPP